MKRSDDLVACLQQALLKTEGIRFESQPLPRGQDKTWRVIVDVQDRDTADTVYRSLWAIADFVQPTREEEMRAAIEAMPTATAERMEALKLERELYEAWPLDITWPEAMPGRGGVAGALYRRLVPLVQDRLPRDPEGIRLVVWAVVEELSKMKKESGDGGEIGGGG